MEREPVLRDLLSECGKAARGASGLCEELGCTKSAEGPTDKCVAHGGGWRCSHEGCGRAARGKTGLCIRHGGGKSCQHPDCTRSAEGQSGLCISHGGGRRCQHPECSKGAQGSTMLCKAHGGGKRCKFEGGCNKGAEGSTPFCKGGKRCEFEGVGVCPKSVHGETKFCVAHGVGFGKRCAIPECTKSARGPKDFCVRHGGGKRCQLEGCGKSAQGSTDFCKGHGGGKRCSWGQRESEFGRGESPCNLFGRGRTGLCAAHGVLVLAQDKRPVQGGAVLRHVVHYPKPFERCQSEGCGKEAQEGSRGFCNAHAGVKRCSWGQGQHESTSLGGTGPCDSFAWEMTGLCTLHGAQACGALVQEKLDRGHPRFRPIVLDHKPSELEKMEEAVIVV